MPGFFKGCRQTSLNIPVCVCCQLLAQPVIEAGIRRTQSNYSCHCLLADGCQRQMTSNKAFTHSLFIPLKYPEEGGLLMVIMSLLLLKMNDWQKIEERGKSWGLEEMQRGVRSMNSNLRIEKKNDITTNSFLNMRSFPWLFVSVCWPCPASRAVSTTRGEGKTL